MILRILGSAAGGGVPQWNCACPNCGAARAGRMPQRSQSGAAVSTDGERWLLLNCSPDIAGQIEAFPPLQPRALRGTPIDGMLLTDANVDHLGGLAVLRQSGAHRFIARSSALTRSIAVEQPAFAPFADSPNRWLEVAFGVSCEPFDAGDPVGRDFFVRALAVPGTTPGYAGRRAEPGAVAAFEISPGRDGPYLVFAPVFQAIDDTLLQAIDRADVAILDGTFFDDDELRTAGLLDKTARSLGHLPVGGPGGTLTRLRGLGSKIVFTHLNNSNPMLDAAGAAAAAVRETGAEVAYDGMEIRW